MSCELTHIRVMGCGQQAFGRRTPPAKNGRHCVAGRPISVAFMLNFMTRIFIPSSKVHLLQKLKPHTEMNSGIKTLGYEI